MGVQALTRLNNKVQAFEAGHDGIPALTAEDIALGLGLIKHDAAGLLGRLKFAGQDNYIRALEALVYRAVSRTARRERWRIHKRGVLRGLSRLSIIEAVVALRCPCCNGTKDRMIDSRVVQCDGCHGTGKYRLSDHVRYQAVGLDHQSWRKTWRARYKNDIQPILDHYERVLAGALAKRMK